MIEIWILEISNYNTALGKIDVDSYLLDNELCRAASIRHTITKTNFIISRYLLRYSLEQYFPGINKKDWKINTNKYGKPYLVRGGIESNIKFNLSHSHGYVSCVISDKSDCGIDIQTLYDHFSIEDIEDEILSEYEKKGLLENSNKNMRSMILYRYWVLKEALLKGLGVGLLGDMKKYSFDLNYNGEEKKEIMDISCRIGTEEIQNWTCKLINISNDFFLSVCINNSKIDAIQSAPLTIKILRL